MNKKRKLITLLALNCIMVPSMALSVLSHSNFWATVRAVDALVLFVAGASVGVALGVLLQQTRKP